MKEYLFKWAENHGYAVAWGNPSLLVSIKDELEGRLKNGEVDRVFYLERLTHFNFPEIKELEKIKSIGVVAVPRPAHSITFHLKGITLEAVIPPTYIHYSAIAGSVIQELSQVLSPFSIAVKRLGVPVKMLAVKLGLAFYGRNNIAYIPGMGSYFQLVGFSCDGDLGSGEWRELDVYSLQSVCEGCSACLKACPTGAIREDRILLNGERCITYWNESLNPWPDWMPASAHSCLVGCIECQRVCPMNEGLLKITSAGGGFSAKETAALLREDGLMDGSMRERIRAKLDAAGLEEPEEEIRRNLRALMASDKANTVLRE